MGAIGVAILARESGLRSPFVFDVGEMHFQTMGVECGGCSNDCEIVLAVRDGVAIDAWGNRCAKGIERAKASVDVAVEV